MLSASEVKQEQLPLHPSLLEPSPLIADQKIIIIGGGIAGLAFPVALRKQWPAEQLASFPSIVIYERDARDITSVAREGYSITIRGDPLAGGVQVLHKMGLLEETLAASVTGRKETRDGAFTIWDRDWRPLLRVQAKGLVDDVTGAPLPASDLSITRLAMREVLIDAVERCENTVVHWETTCKMVEQFCRKSSSSGRCDMRAKVFYSSPSDQNASNSEGALQCDDADLVIVADGANSKIRAQHRPDDSLIFRKVASISGTSRFAGGMVPKPVDKDWGAVLGGGGVGFFASAVDSKSATWSISTRTNHPCDHIVREDTPTNELEKYIETALNLSKSLREPVQTLIKATDRKSLRLRNAMDKQPFRHNYGSIIIFIGDSNHAMSPFAGNGANMALRDAWELSEQFCAHTSLYDAITAYDELSVPRCKTSISRSYWSISVFHAKGLELFLYKMLLRGISAVMWLRGG